MPTGLLSPMSAIPPGKLVWVVCTYYGDSVYYNAVCVHLLNCACVLACVCVCVCVCVCERGGEGEERDVDDCALKVNS